MENRHYIVDVEPYTPVSWRLQRLIEGYELSAATVFGRALAIGLPVVEKQLEDERSEDILTTEDLIASLTVSQS